MPTTRFLCIARVCLISAVSISVGACAGNQTITDNTDPYESVNRKSYKFTDSLDRNLIRPTAETYVAVTPAFAREAVTNFFSNMLYLNVILNSYLQGKFHRGTQDALRFLYNSTFGIGGLRDVSTGIGLPAHEEDVGQTFATWGLSQGPYLFIPVLGPNTVRNLPNIATTTLLAPITYTEAYIFWPLTILYTINTRANLLEATRIRDEAAVDPYVFTREAFLQRRQFLIYDGNPPVDQYDDAFDGGFPEDF